MTRKAAATPEPTPVAETPVAESSVVETPAAEPTPVAAETTTPDLKALREQRRALAEQIKAAKAAKTAAKVAKVAQPKLSALESVIARQAENTRKWLPEILAGRVQARVKAGQPADVALEAVMAQVRAWVEALLNAPEA